MKANHINIISGMRCLLVAVLALLAGCGGGQPSMAPEDAVTQGHPHQAQHISAKGFSLSVLPESFSATGGSAEYSMEAVDSNGTAELTITANDARALKALYLELKYDAARFAVEEARGSGALAAGSGGADSEVIELVVADQPGVLQYGAVLQNWTAQPGVNGTTEMLSIRLGPAGSQREITAKRAASGVPLGSTAMAPLRLQQGVTTVIEWPYTNPGDYDQNKVVTIADLTPLGQYFGSVATDGKFDYRSVLSLVDGDGNGVINISDLTPIGANLGNTVDDYRLYRSADPDADYPATANAASSLLPVAAAESYEWTPTPLDGTPGRLTHYRYIAPDDYDPLDVYWVRPLASGIEGQPSNRSDKSNGLGNQSPVAIISASTTQGEAPLTTTLDASLSYDPDGTIEGYSFGVWGVFESGFSEQPTYETTVTTPGTHYVRLELHDNDLVTFTRYDLTLYVSDQGNFEPELGVMMDPYAQEAPVDFKLDFALSSDLNGDPLTYHVKVFPAYQFDKEYGPEVYSGPNSIYVHHFDEPGNYTLLLWVTDPSGASSDIDHYFVHLSKDGNFYPEAYIIAIQQPAEPAKVNFISSGITDDRGIESVEIDAEGNGNWVEVGTPVDYTHTYAEGGTYMPRYRTTDSDGAATLGNPPAPLAVPGAGTAPIASLNANPTSGIGSLQTTLDASSSHDSNGLIVNYQFNFGDGAGWIDAGSESQVEHDFGPGDYLVEVKVTDNQGLSAIASASVSVQPFEF